MPQSERQNERVGERERGKGHGQTRNTLRHKRKCVNGNFTAHAMHESQSEKTRRKTQGNGTSLMPRSNILFYFRFYFILFRFRFIFMCCAKRNSNNATKTKQFKLRKSSAAVSFFLRSFYGSFFSGSALLYWLH